MEPLNLMIDNELLEAGLKVTGLKSRNKLVEFALRELLRREAQKKLLELKGKIEWAGNLKMTRLTHNDSC
jgi:Arc/MetJ family transcription regulator